MSACEVCPLECLGPTCTPETSSFGVVQPELLLSGHIALPE